ncbi:benzoate 4-monooxygenase cytochrome P450 [Beauveria brongniartii RCEF 3172]|uniref:Benzoate 4-monooxygenase cytochrome P450 n=1 Tax=Beauveria brongniartii RCEF 3172 TaxID=1081107 RepID=A0A166XHJ4_9HYPO|nr:benzoate 4-monooxygenase cytochrome P450 [Beauveria brongniartii RCEF 3172]
MLLVFLLLAVIGCALCYKIVKVITHPLNRFPGPWSASFSNALYSWNLMSGRQPYRQLELHEKYGPVVRVAPNELSFNTASSWNDIYGQRKGVDPFIKSLFYDGGNFAAEALSIVSEREPKKHAEMRRYLAPAFSDRSLKSQEPMITECIDRFIDKLKDISRSGKPADMTMWYHLTTFDIIGSLAFGKDFGGVESGKEHFWVTIVTKSLRLGALADCFRRFPTAAAIFQVVFFPTINKLMKENRMHQKFTMDLV